MDALWYETDDNFYMIPVSERAKSALSASYFQTGKGVWGFAKLDPEEPFEHFVRGGKEDPVFETWEFEETTNANQNGVSEDA